MASVALAHHESGWPARYWAIAFAIPVLLFIGEAGSLLVFEHFRAPNASLVIQLAAMLAFFLLLGVIPRILWLMFTGADKSSWSPRQLLLAIGLLGAGAGAVHLALMAVIKVALYASSEWAGDPVNIAISIGETWLNFGAIWLAVFALMALGTHALWKKRAAVRARPFTFTVRRNDRTLCIAADDVQWIEAEGNYLELHCHDSSYTVRDSLARLAPVLASHGFVRSHRSALVNGRHVRGLRSCQKSSSYRVILASGDEAPLGRRRVAELRELIG